MAISQDGQGRGGRAVPVDELIKKTRTRRLKVHRPNRVTGGLPLRDVRLTLARPPAVQGTEEVLEKNLLQQMHRDYGELQWWERTWEFSQVWDHVRRRHLALLKSYFEKFQPRWKNPAWDDFNQGRRQADAHSARYEQWVQAIFKSMPGQDIPPSRLHGEPAIRAYAKYGPADEPGAASAASREESLADQVAEILAMADNIYGDDPLAGIKLVKESIEMGVLPPAAVNTLPQRLRFTYEQEYLKQNRPASRQSSPSDPGVESPKVII